MSAASASNSAKRRLACKKKLISDIKYLEVTSNIVGPSTTPAQRGSSLSSEESDAKCSPSSKEILIEPEEIYQCTRIWARMNAPIDYNLLARGIEADDAHSTIVESHSSNSYEEMRAFAYMTGTPEEVAKRFEKQAQMQQA